MSAFRKTQSGQLEVLQDGVWTHVPTMAADEIERLCDAVALLENQAARAKSCLVEAKRAANYQVETALSILAESNV